LKLNFKKSENEISKFKSREKRIGASPSALAAEGLNPISQVLM